MHTSYLLLYLISIAEPYLLTDQICLYFFRSWLLGDHLGSTSMVANASGVMVSEVRYSAFGEVRDSSGTMTTDYLYTGQREEAEVGLYYYVARWYDPAIGRFIQADSVVPNPGSAVGFDRYSYAYNNPVIFSDPSGHVPCMDGNCDLFGGRMPDIPNASPRKRASSTPTPASSPTPSPTPAPSRGSWWDGQRAADWANNNKYGYWKYGESNCTNFVSQALLEGGMPMDPIDPGKGWWSDDTYGDTVPWINTGSRFNYLTKTKNFDQIGFANSSGFLSQNQEMTDQLNTLHDDGSIQPGDAVFYEVDNQWDDGHAAIVTGWDQDSKGNWVPLIIEQSGPPEFRDNLPRFINSSTNTNITNVFVVQIGKPGE